MTLYYDNDDDCIVENHPDYAAFDDEGRLVLDIGELRDIRAEKVRRLVDVAVSAVEASDEYAVAQGPDIKWVPEDER